MKINYIKIACFTFAMGVMIGCDDFIDVDPRQNYSEEDSPSNLEPEAFVNGIYGMMTEWDYAFSYLGITEIISDNADKGSSPGDPGGDKALLDGLTHTASSGSFEAMWANWYKAIGRATYSIEYTENYGLTDEAYKNRLIGEAKFLRAYHYFFLVRGWGDVPLQHIDLINRVPKAEVYDYIEQDLLEAIAVLPEKSEYAYKLESSFNKDDWHNIGSQHYINLTNLNSGTYLLKIKTSNGHLNLNRHRVLSCHSN